MGLIPGIDRDREVFLDGATYAGAPVNAHSIDFLIQSDIA